MSIAYTIEYVLAETPWRAAAGSAIAQRTLRALGLRYNAPSPTKRVFVEGSGGAWGVDVPADRAEEYARQAWKDEHTRSVTIGEGLGAVSFPKPIENKELEEFKKKVAQVALRTKNEENWCNDGFKAAMKELGIPLPDRNAQIVMEIELPFDVDPDDLEAVQEYVKNKMTALDLSEKIESTEGV